MAPLRLPEVMREEQVQKHKTAHYVHHSPVPYILPGIKYNWRGTWWTYRKNSLRVNYDKMQITAFHLRHRETKRSCKVSWNIVDLENTAQPKYLGVTFNRTLSYKQHIHNTMIKVATRTNLLKILVSSKCGTNTSSTRTTVLAMCYSIAEYVTPIYARSSHAYILDTKLNKGWRAITWCLKSIYLKYYLLAGIVPPNIRSYVYVRMK